MADDLHASRESANRTLMQALWFTAKDLEANRNGELTEAQREHLERLRRWSPPPKKVPVAALQMTLMLLFLSFVATGFLSGLALVLIESLLLLTALASGGFVVDRLLRERKRPPDNLASVSLTTRKGRVERLGRELAPTALEPCVLSIDGFRIPVSAPVADAFVDGRRYRVNFVLLDRRRIVVSAEQTHP